jgi:hypothetical protein
VGTHLCPANPIYGCWCCALRSCSDDRYNSSYNSSLPAVALIQLARRRNDRRVAGKIPEDRLAEIEEFGLRLAGRTGVSDKQHRLEVKSGGLGQKAVLAPREASSWGSARDWMRPPFFPSSLTGRQVSCNVLPQLLHVRDSLRVQVGHPLAHKFPGMFTDSLTSAGMD